GLPVLQIADLANVWLKVYVAETQVGLIKPGQLADVTVDSFAGKIFKGRVSEIAEIPEFTPKNVQTRDERTKLVFWVKIAIENPDLELKPGMPGDAVIHIDTPTRP
ncbi:MAG TPA: efflux RND transporter periplasmic adaptor subunit, partial [Candidatus Ozemobacteraceae bacterium]|nr:efflux RND transporter periplasmic adaptor subunit [Candidatus Ozemobacteraceae bacterium]